MQEELGSLDAYLWSFVDGEPIQNAWRELSELPAETDISKQMSKDLKKRGWTFVGPTTVYAFMQAMGLVNDHVPGCDCREACEAERAALVRPTHRG